MNKAGTDVTIDNSNGGMIEGNATINISPPNISLGGNLFTAIDNSSGGNIGGNATINMNISGNAAWSPAMPL